MYNPIHYTHARIQSMGKRFIKIVPFLFVVVVVESNIENRISSVEYR